MARRKKEPWELEPALGGGDIQDQESSTGSGATGGGRGLHCNGDNTSNKPLSNIDATPQAYKAYTTQPAEPSIQTATSHPTQNDIQQSQTVVKNQEQAKPTGNSGGHLSTVKTNYTKGSDAAGKALAGTSYGNSHGRTQHNDNVRSTATKAAASGSYQNRDSSLSQEQREGKAELERERGEKMSNTYNKDGERMTKSEFKDYKNELKSSDIQGMRRIIISPDPALGINEQEMISITRDTMWAWAEKSGKQFDFSFAVHDGQSVIHSHVMMYSDNANDINMASKQLETFKGLVDQTIENQLDVREELGLGQDIADEQSISQGDGIQQGQGDNDEKQLNQLNSGGDSDDFTTAGGGGEDAAAAAEAAEAEELMMMMAL